MRNDRTRLAAVTLVLMLLTLPAWARPKAKQGPSRYVSPSVGAVQDTMKKLQRLARFTCGDIERILGVSPEPSPEDPPNRYELEAEISTGVFTRVELREFDPDRPAAPERVILTVRQERAPKLLEFPDADSWDCAGNLVVVHGGPWLQTCVRTELGRRLAMTFRRDDGLLQEVSVSLPPRSN